EHAIDGLGDELLLDRLDRRVGALDDDPLLLDLPVDQLDAVCDHGLPIRFLGELLDETRHPASFLSDARTIVLVTRGVQRPNPSDPARWGCRAQSVLAGERDAAALAACLHLLLIGRREPRVVNLRP